MAFHSFNTVIKAVNNATEHFSEDGWVLNKESLGILKDCCNDLDDIIIKNRCKSINVSTESDTMNLRVLIETANIDASRGFEDVEVGCDVFSRLSERVLSIGFLYYKGDRLLLEFIFPGVWDKEGR